MRVFVLLVVALHQVALGGFEQTEVGARAKSLGGAYCGMADDVWAIVYNVGGLAAIKQREVSMFYAPQQFGLSELSLSAVAAVFPTGVGSFGLAARRYGFDLYREVSWTVAYAREIFDAGVGVNVNYHSVTIQGYGSSGTVGIDVGALVQITSQLRWGIAAKNINAPTIGESEEPLPQLFSTGVTYQPVRNLSLLLDYCKEISFASSQKIGFEYSIVEAVVARAGLSSEPSEYTGGIGIRYGVLQIDYGVSMHQELGLTQQASILICW